MDSLGRLTVRYGLHRKICNRGASAYKSLEHHISAVMQDMKIVSTEEIFKEYQAVFCHQAIFCHLFDISFRNQDIPLRTGTSRCASITMFYGKLEYSSLISEKLPNTSVSAPILRMIDLI